LEEAFGATNMAREPLLDEERLKKNEVLGLFMQQGGPFGSATQVWDFSLDLP
jgi:hypothetical protein